MRIALVTTSFPAEEGDPSGHFVQAEARRLEAQGHEVIVVMPRPGGAFGWPGVAARIRERPARLLDAARWVMQARTRLRQIEAHRVVAHWAVPCAWPVAMGSRAELHVVSHGGDVRLLVRMPRVARERVVGAIAGRAATWTFVSEALMESLLAVLGEGARRDLARVAVVRAATIEMPDVRAAVARKRGELGAARVAVSVGRLVRSKRVDRAIEHVARTRDIDTLVVVGDGPERGRLEALAHARAVDVRFVGILPREETLAWIGAASVVLFASQHEGASTVLREATAMGATVIMVANAEPGATVRRE
jgi:glycosyltransferase involved in cell wall biosynthesis